MTDKEVVVEEEVEEIETTSGDPTYQLDPGTHVTCEKTFCTHLLYCISAAKHWSAGHTCRAERVMLLQTPFAAEQCSTSAICIYLKLLCGLQRPLLGCYPLVEQMQGYWKHCRCSTVLNT